ncbi:hypothetical protein N7532_007975 [Penicillium argentinense]|uniref:Retrotransposon Copia-like N-terminal domain-containing protein n=1 Tax=Penicillium argentinense TaxID=1131581 RepID=A0A9W9EWS4_9EURO|nr:uncharacterized protein N7532_007975 [Penicillium argentinense]KAJ5089291.1 hypothetical protein N7532_007975 [Penicillium argentinense]
MEKRLQSLTKLHSRAGEIQTVIEELNGARNYRQWKKNMLILLGSNGLLQFVVSQNRLVAPPEEHHLYFEWVRLNYTAGRTIVQNVSKSISRDVARLADQPHLLWKLLETQYAANSVSIARSGMEAAISIRYSKCRGISEYARKVQAAWNDIFVGRGWSPEFEWCRCLALITGLDTPEWTGWKTTWDTIAKEQRNPMDEYHFRSIVHELSTQETANRQHQKWSMVAATNNSSKPESKGSRKTCTYCRKPSHTEPDCWRKHPEKRPKDKSKGSNVQSTSNGKPQETESLITTTVEGNPVEPPLYALSTDATVAPDMKRWVVDTACDDYMISSPN